MRHWLITGAASGLGRCLFEAAVATGDCATATVRRVEDAETLERLAPGRAKAIILDLSDSMVVREVASKLDGIDVLVNNAGYSLEGVVEATSAEEMRALFDVMLFAPVELIKAVLPAMRSQGCARNLVGRSRARSRTVRRARRHRRSGSLSDIDWDLQAIG